MKLSIEATEYVSWCKLLVKSVNIYANAHAPVDVNALTLNCGNVARRRESLRFSRYSNPLIHVIKPHTRLRYYTNYYV